MSETATIKDARGVLNNRGPQALRQAALDVVPFTPEAASTGHAQPEQPQAKAASETATQVVVPITYPPKRRKPAQAQDPATRFCYDGSRYYLDTAREFVPMDQRSVARHMRGWGNSHDEVEAAICRIQTVNHIHFAGPLAGHPRGLHTVGGTKLLALTSPQIIGAKPGPWPILRRVFEGLLLDPEVGSVQLETFLGWLKIARESLLTNRRRPGQAIAFAGPRGSGKSLLIDITELALGGRRANPYAYFTGRTNFNGDLSGAELLAVDDEAGSTDIRSRRTLAANIKSCLFSGAVRIEGKNKCAFVFQPCWRMILALNDEPEALLVLPPIGRGFFSVNLLK